MKRMTIVVLAALMVAGLNSPARSVEPAQAKNVDTTIAEERFEDTVAKDGVRAPAARRDVAAAVRELKATAEKEGRVAVMASLDVPFAAEATLHETDVTAQRAEIAAAQRVVAEVVRLNGGTVRRTPESVPAISFDATPQTLDAAARLSQVASMRQVETLSTARGTSVPAVFATRTHRASLNGQGRTVAVIDTGVATGHAEFSGRVALQACFVQSGCPGGGTTATGAGSGAPCTGDMNDCAHGSHVAGIAVGSNGVARGGRLATIRVFDNGGDSAADDDILAAIDHVYTRRSTLRLAAINLSLGGDGSHNGDCDDDYPDMYQAMYNAKTAGIAPVVAAGNDGWRNAVSFPACITPAISVANLARKSDGTYEFASDTNVNFKTTIGAPGTNIRSTVPGGGTAVMSGTSMAAPHVAGAFAFVRQHSDWISVDRAYDYLRTGARLTDQRSSGTDSLNMLRTDPALVSMQAWMNNNFGSATVLSENSGQVTGRNVGTSSGRGFLAAYGKQVGEPNHGGSAGGRSVWFRWNIPQATFSGWATVDTSGSGFDTLLGVYTGTSVGGLTKIADNDDANGTLASAVTFDTSGGRTLYIAVDGYRNTSTGRAASGDYVLNFAFSQRYPSFGPQYTDYPNWVYGRAPDGTLSCSAHDGYLTGANSWSFTRVSGTGWNMFKKTFTGTGAIYGITPDGRLFWYKHTGRYDCQPTWEGGYVTSYFDYAPWHEFKEVFGMTTSVYGKGGVIYAIANDGTLRWYKHHCYSTGGAGWGSCWTGGHVVGTGWNTFKKVWAGGDGVIYGLKDNGDILWYRHTGYGDGSVTWEGPVLVGTGWNMYKDVLGGGNEGVIYGIAHDGTWVWYRHTGRTNGTVAWQGPYNVGPRWSGSEMMMHSWVPETPIR